MICKVSRIFPASFYLPSASCTTEHALREPSWPMPVFSRHTALLLLLAFSLKCPAVPAKLEDLPRGHIQTAFSSEAFSRHLASHLSLEIHPRQLRRIGFRPLESESLIVVGWVTWAIAVQKSDVLWLALEPSGSPTCDYRTWFWPRIDFVSGYFLGPRTWDKLLTGTLIRKGSLMPLAAKNNINQDITHWEPWHVVI